MSGEVCAWRKPLRRSRTWMRRGYSTRAGYLASLFTDSPQSQTIYPATSEDSTASQMPAAWLAIPETLYQLDQRPFPLNIGSVIYQKACYVLTDAGVSTGFDFIQGGFGPFSTDATEALAHLERAGLVEQDTVGRKHQMNKVRLQPIYEAERNSLLTQLAPVQPIIERTIELFRLVKNTRDAEEIGTVLFSARQIERERKEREVTRDALHKHIIEWKNRWDSVDKRKRLDIAINNLVKLGFISIKGE